MDPFLQQAAFFALNFFSIMASLIFYSIFAWVICTWLIMFGIIGHDNKGFGFLSQLVYPILRPFRWAKIGMIDLSPIMALAVLGYLVMPALNAALLTLIG